MSRYIQKIIKDIKQDVSLNGNSVVVSNTHTIDGHEVAPFDPSGITPVSGDEITGDVNVDDSGHGTYPVTNDPNHGTPGPPPYNYNVPAPEHEEVSIVTVRRRYRESIRDYSDTNLDRLEELGVTFYAVLNDGTELEVTREEVFDPRKPVTPVTINLAQIAESKNQHFWTDTNGAHVTDDMRSSWDDEYNELDHGTLAHPTLNNPWHNILLNSYGILLRKGLINLSAFSDSSVSFFDGLGNESSNILATFGVNGAQIGKSTEKHLVLDSTGVNAYNGDGTQAPIHASNIDADHATIEDLEANKADITYLNSNFANINELTAATGRIDNLSSIILQAMYADIDNLTADEIAATNISALNAALTHLDAGSVTAQELTTINAFIEMLAASRITTNYLNANYADIGLLNVNTEWLNHGVIKEASISDAMIVGVSANKLTAGEIDASKIRVSNLMANNILVNMINNVPVSGATVADALSMHDTNINNINTRLDDELASLNARVDSQIETHTIQNVPTLNNYPANEWLVYLTDSNDQNVLDSTNDPILVEDLRASHVGDIAYVTNAGSEADGYSYRYVYDRTTNTYDWVLIKDNQITDFIQRMIDAEGKIDGLETFESTTSEWITNTDQGLQTIRNNVTTITGSINTLNQTIDAKVDTSTFQTIVDEIDEQSSTISTLTTEVDTIGTTIEGLATKGSVTTVTNLVNQVKQTADTNSSTIKSLEQQTSDLYGVSDTINERVSSLNQSLDGFTTTVSNIYSDITDTNKSLNQLKASYAISYTAGNNAAKTADSWLSYLMDSNGNYVLDSSNNKIELYDDLSGFILLPGNKLSCTFANANTANNPTLNINGTGAKPILSYTGESLSEEEIKWEANSTFEFVYDGTGWRLQDSGSIKRVSAAETQIEQNSEAISLRATKTEVTEAVDNIQVGGRNLAIVKDQTLTPTEYSALTMYISSPLIADTKYILQLWDIDISHSGRQNDLNLAVYYCGGSVQLIKIDKEYLQGGHCDYFMAEFTPTTANVSHSIVNSAGNRKFIRFYNSVPSTSGTKNLTIARVKLEKGTKPTDWTPAPEDMQSVEQAEAELRITNESINSKVAKTDYTGNTVVSMINQTPDEIKIQARHVEIDGVAVFSNREFKESLNERIGEVSSYVESIGTDLLTYMNTNESALNSLSALLQNQKDNQVDVWYYTTNPTLANVPYIGWLYLTDSNNQIVLDHSGNPIQLEDTRQSHVGDLYFNTETGYSYRFVKDNNTYSWVRIKDTDITSALSAAQGAQSTADNKRRIFTSRPTVPYDIGDLWVNGSTVKYATVKKTSSQSYAEADWNLTATDDTMAKENLKSSIRLWRGTLSFFIPEPPSEPVTPENMMVDGWAETMPIGTDEVSFYYFYCDQHQKGDGEYYWTDVIYDRALTESAMLARSVSDDLASYIKSNDSVIESLELDFRNQLDSQVDIWYYNTDPTLSNAPYNSWLYLTDSNGQNVLDNNNNPIATEDIRQNHLGDLYYNTQTGYSYRFAKDGNSYTWLRIKDSDIDSVLEAANDAKAVADSKRTIFTSRPTVPYDIGDLWVNGSTVKYATVKKTSSQYYTDSDWVLTATDDTLAKSNMKNHVQLWFTKSNTTPPNKPTSNITSTSTSGNAWRVVVPVYNKNYPYYFYCYQYQKGDNTYAWTDVVYDTAMTEAQKVAREASDGLADYIRDNDQALEDLEELLQGQIDEQVDIWFYATEPALNKAPVTSWTDDATKQKHVNDLYYDTSKGYAYRFTKSGSTYSWTRIKDTDISSALAAANTAQTTADNKRRVFSSTPTVPYDIGDLWVNGNVVKYAKTKKTSSQTYNAADWVTTATDDTVANQNIKSTIQLWYTKGDTTLPSKPSSEVTSTSTAGNGWRKVIPEYTSSYPYYFYCYQNQKANGEYSWTDVVYDRAMSDVQRLSRAAAPATSAVSTSQRIYYRSSSSTTPNLPTSWVIKASDSYANNATTTSNWTKKYSPLDNGKIYKYMWTCTQNKTVSGSLFYSTVVIDDTETVIDGGNIITASIKANKLDIADVNASNSLTVGAFTSSTQDDISNSTYITKIDNSGIRVHAKNNASSNYVGIDAYGMKTFKDGSQVASFGDTILLGSTSSQGVQVNSSGVQVYKGGTQRASFADTILLGSTSNQGVQVNSNGMQVYKDGAQKASFGDTILLGSTSNQGVQVNSNGMQVYKDGAQKASFGDTVTLGSSNNSQTVIDSSSFAILSAAKKTYAIEFAAIHNDMIRDYSIAGEVSGHVVIQTTERVDTSKSYVIIIDRIYKPTGYKYSQMVRTTSSSPQTNVSVTFTNYTHDTGHQYTSVSVRISLLDDYDSDNIDDYIYFAEISYYKYTSQKYPAMDLGVRRVNGYYWRFINNGNANGVDLGFDSIISGSGNTVSSLESSFLCGPGNRALKMSESVLVGKSNYFAGMTSSICLGSENYVASYFIDSTIIGRSNRITNYGSTLHVILGSYNTLKGSHTRPVTMIGQGLISDNTTDSQTIIGQYNKAGTYIFAVGAGLGEAAGQSQDDNPNPSMRPGRQNALTVYRNGSVYMNGSSVSDGTSVTSDKRVKTLIANITKEESSEFISKLIPRKYYKTSNGNTFKQVGFYAQDIEDDEDFGEYLVTIDKSDNYDIEDFRLLNYQGLIAPMVGAIQDLQNKVSDLEKKNQELEERLTRLEELLLNR